MRRVRALLASLVLCLPAGASSGAEAPTRRALLIGINQYIEVPSLNGAINDVEMIYEILTTRFGFAASDIETVTDAAATREGILAAIDRLAERSRAGDLIYIHYSGHGSQVADLNGDETDQLDETLVPHDGRTPDIRDITDDELGEAFARVKGSTVVITLDSCHSGTATRGLSAIRSRSVPPDGRTELYESVRTRAVVPLTAGGHLLMAGAADYQEALDGPVDGRPYGLFSYSLARSMSNAPLDASPRTIFSGVKRELERIKAQLGLASMPEPQLEAPALRLDRALFPRKASPEDVPIAVSSVELARLPWLRVEPEGDGRVRLVRGPRLGAVPGSEWAIHGPGESEFAPGDGLAQALVTTIDGDDALAVLEPAEAAVASGSRAVAISPAPVSDVVSVRLRDRDAERGERLRSAIRAELAMVEFVEPGRFARFVVDIDEQRCRVSAADGYFDIAEFPIESEVQLARSLGALFARSMTAAELLSLENTASAFQLEVGLVGESIPSIASPGDDVVSLQATTAAPRFRIRREGEPRSARNSLQLRLRSSAACSLAVVDVDTEGGVHLLFPNALSEKNAYHPGGAIAADEEILLPDSLSSGNRSGFHLDYVPPAGVDTIRAFCFADPKVAAMFTDSLRQLELAGQSLNSSAGRRRVRSLLLGWRRPLARASARGVAVVAAAEPPDTDEPTEAATASVTVAPPEPVAPVEPPAPTGSSVSASESESGHELPVDWAAASVTVSIDE